MYIKTALFDIGVTLFFIIILCIPVAFIGSFIPYGEEQTMTGYASDVIFQIGYGYSGTTIILDNHTENFDSKYNKNIPLNTEIIITYQYSLIGGNKIIKDIKEV